MTIQNIKEEINDKEIINKEQIELQERDINNENIIGYNNKYKNDLKNNGNLKIEIIDKNNEFIKYNMKPDKEFKDINYEINKDYQPFEQLKNSIININDNQQDKNFYLNNNITNNKENENIDDDEGEIHKNEKLKNNNIYINEINQEILIEPNSKKELNKSFDDIVESENVNNFQKKDEQDKYKVYSDKNYLFKESKVIN